MTTITKAAWRKRTPRSVYEAAEWVGEYGRQHKQMSRERLCDHFGNELSTTGKWISQANMPLKKIINFEQLCGINFVTQYLAQAQGYLLVKVPSGRKAEHTELAELQIFMTEVSALLIKTYDGRANDEETINALKKLMQDLAFHERNVSVVNQPQHELSLVNDNA